MKQKLKERAFTLIEMLTVIILIGIVLAIVIPSVTNIMANRSKKEYDIFIKVVDKATRTYIDEYKGQLVNQDSKCFNIDYQALIKDGLKENNIHCSGNIIISKSDNNKQLDPSYYLTCVDNDNKTLHKSDPKPVGCRGFNGKFKMDYSIYTDSSYSKPYDGTYYTKNAYVIFESTSPYSSPISHYEYTTSLDGNWKTISSGSNLGTIQDLKNYVGTVYVRSVDEDGNTSTNVSFPVKMDNAGPVFNTSVAGSYLIKKLSIYDVKDNGIGTLAENAYSFDGGNTWGKETTKEYTSNTTVNVCTKDIFENINCKDVKITGIDRVAPTIVATSSKVYITKGTSKNISDYFKITYSPLGGSVKCTVDNTNSLAFGLNTVTCTATGVNTLTASASVVIAHQYNATAYCSGGRTLNNGNCTYYYANNESKCGCSAYKSCQNSACGSTNKTCRTAACGVASYNTCQSSACGSTNNTCTTSACGVASYNSCANSACGVASYKNCAHKDCGQNKSCSKLYSCVGGSGSTCGSPPPACNKGLNVQGGYTIGGDCNCKYTNKTCRTAACGVESYNTCATSACGVASYKTCQNAACGSHYNTCATAACGVSSYKECQSADCGSYYNTCRTSACGCETAASCTKNENEYRYYQCDSKGNTGTNGTLSGSTCSF